MRSRTAILLWAAALGLASVWVVGCGSGEGEEPAPAEGRAFKRPTRLWPDVPPPPEPSADAAKILEPASGKPEGDKETSGAETEGAAAKPPAEEPGSEEPGEAS